MVPAPVRMAGVSEKPGRYQRSTGGLFGALLVTLVVIVAFVAFRGLLRDNLEIEPEPVDYADAATAAREAGFDVVAPKALPAEWMATDVDLRQTDPPVWGLSILTGEGKFIGLRQQTSSVASLIEMTIDEDAVEGKPLELDSAVGSTWSTWTDEGGDTGYLMELGSQRLLVYGSAPADDLQTFITLLER